MSELKQQWRALDHCEPPLRISPELLTRALAYRIQEEWPAPPSTRQV